MLAAIAATFLLGSPPELNVVYSHAGGSDLAMDIYPAEGVSIGARPAVLVVHGGAWITGKKEQWTDLCKNLSSQGIFAATVEYRLAPKFKWPAMLDDCQTAVRFLRANAGKYHIDPDRIGAAGDSAGGQLVLLLGSTETRDPHITEYPGLSSRVSAVFDMYGPVDMTIGFKNFDALFLMVIGKKRADAFDEIKAASPVTYIDEHSAPTFILQGTADPVVAFSQSQLLDKAMTQHHVPHELDLVNGMGHGVDMTKSDQADGMKRGIEWLKKYLGGGTIRQAA